MIKRGYNKRLATGSVVAGGTLGILIPPSIPFIIYGSLTEQSVGKLFFAGVIPGILLTVMFMVYIIIACVLKPDLATKTPSATWKERFKSLKQTWAVVLLVVLVMGSIYTGVTTPTEAAAIGAFGALALAMAYRRLTWKSLSKAMLRTSRTTSFCLFIVIGAVSYGWLMRATQEGTMALIPP